MRLHAMQLDGDIHSPPLPLVDAARLAAAVESALQSFATDHGGHPDFIAALYSQACAAMLSATFSGARTATMATLTKRSGSLCVEVFARHHAHQGAAARSEVAARLNREYVVAVQAAVWGDAQGDLVWQTFFA